MRSIYLTYMQQQRCGLSLSVLQRLASSLSDAHMRVSSMIEMIEDYTNELEEQLHSKKNHAGDGVKKTVADKKKKPSSSSYEQLANFTDRKMALMIMKCVEQSGIA